MRYRNHTTFLVFLYLLILLLTARTLKSQSMESPRFNIEYGDVEFSSPDSSTPEEVININPITRLNGEQKKQLNEQGYILTVGNEYLNSNQPISAGISKTIVTFNPLTPNTPQSQSTLLSLSALSTPSYTVKLLQEEPLISFNKKELTSGFQYTAKGVFALSELKNGNTFKSLSLNTPLEIIKGNLNIVKQEPTKNQKSEVVFKVGITAEEQVNTYYTTVNTLVVASY